MTSPNFYIMPFASQGRRNRLFQAQLQDGDETPNELLSHPRIIPIITPYSGRYFSSPVEETIVPDSLEPMAIGFHSSSNTTLFYFSNRFSELSLSALFAPSTGRYNITLTYDEVHPLDPYSIQPENRSRGCRARLLIWNCRGLRQPHNVELFNALFLDYKFNIALITETRMPMLPNIREALDTPFGPTNVLQIGGSEQGGGMVLIWNGLQVRPQIWQGENDFMGTIYPRSR